MAWRVSSCWGVRIDDVEWPASYNGRKDSDLARVHFRIGAEHDPTAMRLVWLVFVRGYDQETAMQAACNYLDRTLRPIANDTRFWRFSQSDAAAFLPEILDPARF